VVVAELNMLMETTQEVVAPLVDLVVVVLQMVVVMNQHPPHLQVQEPNQVLIQEPQTLLSMEIMVDLEESLMLVAVAVEVLEPPVKTDQTIQDVLMVVQVEQTHTLMDQQIQ
tara:strand:- start:1235 stop:1570 length:336 start_codon:yes stop_codon:yes gene_type:complete